MVFTESQLATTNSYSFLNEADNILSEAFMLDPGVSALSPLAIPVVENAAIERPVVHYNDIVRLAEENIIAYDEAMFIVAEANGIDPENLVVSVPDYEITANPSIVDEMYNVAVIPTTSDDIVYTYMEACMDCFLETGDEDFLYSMADDRIIIEAGKTIVTIDPKTGKEVRKSSKGISDTQWKNRQQQAQQDSVAKKEAIKNNGRYFNNPTELFKAISGKSYNSETFKSKNLANNSILYNNLARILKDSDFGRKPVKIRNTEYMISPETAENLNKILTKAVNNNGGYDPGVVAPGSKMTPEKKARLKELRDNQAARQAAKNSPVADGESEQEEETNGQAKVGSETPASTAEVQKKLTMFQNIKNTLINKPRTFLARKLQWLRNWAEQHLSNLPTENRTIWQKIKAKVYEIINWITNKLGTTKGGRVEDIDHTINKDYDA